MYNNKSAASDRPSDEEVGAGNESRGSHITLGFYYIKVVEYLLPDIPRILINRNIVRVPKVSQDDDDCLYHACLFGNCDDMKGNGSQSKSNELGTKGLVMKDEPWLQNNQKKVSYYFLGLMLQQL